MIYYKLIMNERKINFAVKNNEGTAEEVTVYFEIDAPYFTWHRKQTPHVCAYCKKPNRVTQKDKIIIKKSLINYKEVGDEKRSLKIRRKLLFLARPILVRYCESSRCIKKHANDIQTFMNTYNV